MSFLAVFKKFIGNIASIILEAIFPVSTAEKELIFLGPKKALEVLPKATIPPISSTYSVFAYKDERVTKLIWSIKYKKSAECVKIGAYALFYFLQDFQDDVLQDRHSSKVPKSAVMEDKIPKIVVPMPITSRRRRERGYNQCELLTDEIAALNKLDKNPNGKQFQIVDDLLIRTQHTSRQTLKNRNERLESAKELFSIDMGTLQKIKASHEKHEHLTIFVVDDVITTGSTMKEAMETLKNAGFVHVYGISIAH